MIVNFISWSPLLLVLAELVLAELVLVLVLAFVPAAELVLAIAQGRPKGWPPKQNAGLDLLLCAVAVVLVTGVVWLFDLLCWLKWE